MQKNAKNGTFFYKERKRTQRTERSFEKNGCPTLTVCDLQKRAHCLLIRYIFKGSFPQYIYSLYNLSTKPNFTFFIRTFQYELRMSNFCKQENFANMIRTSITKLPFLLFIIYIFFNFSYQFFNFDAKNCPIGACPPGKHYFLTL